MGSKKILFLTLIFIGVLSFAGSFKASADCISCKSDCQAANTPEAPLNCDQYCASECSSDNSCAGKTAGSSCTGALIGGGVCINGQCDINKDLQCYNESDGTTCNIGSCQSEKCVASSDGGISSPKELLSDDGGISSPKKCDLARFEEFAGVCFPIDTGLSETPVEIIIMNFMYWLLGIFGFIAIIGFAISGIQYLTSAGDEKGIETAKRNVKWSIVGAIVALAGLVIVYAVDAALRANPYF